MWEFSEKLIIGSSLYDLNDRAIMLIPKLILELKSDQHIP